MINLGPVIKALLAGLGAAATASTAAQQDGHVDPLEWVAIVLGFVVGAVATYFADNARVLGYAKTLSALITALAAGVFAALADGQGITGNEWLSLIIAAASAFTVSQAPNSVASDPPVPEDVQVDPDWIPEAHEADPGPPPAGHADLGKLARRFAVGFALVVALLGGAVSPAAAATLHTSLATYRAGSGFYLTTSGTDGLAKVGGRVKVYQTDSGPIKAAVNVSGLPANTVFVAVPYKDGGCVAAAGVTAFPTSSFLTDANGAAKVTVSLNPAAINPAGQFTVAQTHSVSIRQVLVNGRPIHGLPVPGIPSVPNVGAVEGCDRHPVTR